MDSPHVSSSSLSLIPEENAKMNPTTSKSCESLYSNSSKSSAHIIYSRKTNAGINNKSDCFRATRQPAIIPATSEVRQRVLSARRLRMKTYQNQLADAQQTIAELAHENRILRTLHKRQDSALSKYESNNAELPQLLHSHAEELRVWQTKHRNLLAINKELEQKLKQKETLILSLSDQNKYYIQLNKDKNLEERQRLTEKLNVLETRLQEKDNDIKMMTRKMQLEAKQVKLQLQLEQKRNKEFLVKLEKARLELSGYRKVEDFQEKLDMNLKRNKSEASPKLEKEFDKYSLTNITEAETGDEIEAPTSQRSIHSYHQAVQQSNRSIKNTTTKTKSTLSSSTIVLHQAQAPKQQTPASKTISVLRRVDQGDGDACNTRDGYKLNGSLNTSSLMQRQHSNLSSVTQNQEEVLRNDYGDEEYENDVDELKKTIEREENLTGNQADETDEDEIADYVISVEGLNDETDDSALYKQDYFTDNKKFDNYNPGAKARIKEDISNIRKQITEDFQEREAFLDTFCRQATNAVSRNKSETKRNSNTGVRSVPNSHKHKLLAALKAIDDNKDQD